MDARHQTARAASHENFAGLRDGERAAIAEYVAEFGESCHGHGGNPIVPPADSHTLRAAAIFRRDHMRAEKRGMNIQRLFLMQFAEERKDFEFAFPVEAVAAFRFDRRGAVAANKFRLAMARSFSALGACGAGFYRGTNPTTVSLRSLRSWRRRCAASYSLARLRGENQMRVRIYEARQNDAAREIDLFGAARLTQFFDSAAWTDGCDAVFVDQDCAVENDAEVAESFAAAGNWSAQGQQLRAAGDEQVGHGCSDTNAAGE